MPCVRFTVQSLCLQLETSTNSSATFFFDFCILFRQSEESAVKFTRPTWSASASSTDERYPNSLSQACLLDAW